MGTVGQELERTGGRGGGVWQVGEEGGGKPNSKEVPGNIFQSK